MSFETTLSSNKIMDALHWRYATKKFDPTQKLSSQDWHQLQEVLQLSASSFGIQPYRFVVVTDPALKQTLLPACWNQQQVTDCSHLIVFSRVKEISEALVSNYIHLMAETRHVSPDTLQGLHDQIVGYIAQSSEQDLAQWASAQCYIALGNLLTVAAEMHIDACPMEGFQKEALDRVLELPEKGCHSVVLCALGYRDASDKYGHLAKVRHPIETLFITL